MYGGFFERHKEEQREIFRSIHAFAEQAYIEGLTEAWDYARKIANIDFDCVKVFDVPFKNDVFTNFDVQEAMEKIIKYERQKHTDKGCESCKYEDEPEFTSPCVDCSRNHKDMWEAKR